MFLCGRHGCFIFHVGGPVQSGASSAPRLSSVERCEQPDTPAHRGHASRLPPLPSRPSAPGLSLLVSGVTGCGF